MNVVLSFGLVSRQFKACALFFHKKLNSPEGIGNCFFKCASLVKATCLKVQESFKTIVGVMSPVKSHGYMGDFNLLP